MFLLLLVLCQLGLRYPPSPLSLSLCKGKQKEGDFSLPSAPSCSQAFSSLFCISRLIQDIRHGKNMNLSISFRIICWFFSFQSGSWGEFYRAVTEQLGSCAGGLDLRCCRPWGWLRFLGLGEIKLGLALSPILSQWFAQRVSDGVCLMFCFLGFGFLLDVLFSGRVR